MFFGRLNLNLSALVQIIGGIDHDLCVFGQAIEHFQTRAEIAPDMNILPVNNSCTRIFCGGVGAE